MKVWHKITLLTGLVIVLTTLIVSYSWTVMASPKVKKHIEQANSTITLSSGTEDEMRASLVSNIATWQSGEAIVINYPGGQLIIPKTLLIFDIEKSLNDLHKSGEDPWYRFWNPKDHVELELDVQITDLTMLQSISSVIDMALTEEKLLSYAGSLQYGEIEAVSTTSLSNVEETISTFSVDIPAAARSVDKLSQLLDGYQFVQQGELSILELVDEGLHDKDSMDVLASALYGASLSTNLEILERHQQLAVPSFTEPGTEAVVERDQNKDLKLFNPNHFPLTISSNVIGNRLEINIQGIPLEGIYQMETHEQEDVEPRTVKRYSNSLTAGQEVVVQDGKDGLRTEILRVHRSAEGEIIQTEIMSQDFYAPTPHVIELSSYIIEQSSEAALNGSEEADNDEDIADQPEEETSSVENTDTSDSIQSDSDQQKTSNLEIEQESSGSIDSDAGLTKPDGSK